MINIAIIETGLELVPKKYRKYPSVQKYAKIRDKPAGEILLDIGVHKIGKEYKGGRPDIVHLSLLLLQNSELNEKNQLQVWIHTKNNEIIKVHPSTRIPKNYYRFCSLIEELLKTKHSKFFKIREGTVQELITKIEPNRTILMQEKGEDIKTLKPKDGDLLLIGGFQKGEFEKEIPNTIKIRVSKKPVETIRVIHEILKLYELSL